MIRYILYDAYWIRLGVLTFLLVQLQLKYASSKFKYLRGVSGGHLVELLLKSPASMSKSNSPRWTWTRTRGTWAESTKSTSPRCRTYTMVLTKIRIVKNGFFVWSVCRRIGNKTEWDVQRWFYPDICSPAQAPYWPHPFPLHTRHPIEIPTHGVVFHSHDILLSGILGLDLEHLSSGTSLPVLLLSHILHFAEAWQMGWANTVTCGQIDQKSLVILGSCCMYVICRMFIVCCMFFLQKSKHRVGATVSWAMHINIPHFGSCRPPPFYNTYIFSSLIDLFRKDYQQNSSWKGGIQ